jgi:hypothetical protein
MSTDFKSGERSREWVARLPSVISALNNEITRATSMKPSNAITKNIYPAAITDNAVNNQY